MLNRKILLYILLVFILNACGDGGSGGPKEEAQKKAKNTIVVTAYGKTGDVSKYKALNGVGDEEFDVSLDKEGLYIISFAHKSSSSSKKNDDAILTIKKDGKTLKYFTRKSINDLENDKRILSEFFVYKGQSGIFSFTVDTPESKDSWIIDIGHKSDFPEDLKEVFVDKLDVKEEKGNDILYKYQWHLKNIGQDSYSITPAIEGNDINVEALWNGEAIGKKITGKGVNVAVIDEGVEINHPDLIDNIDVNLSWNYIKNSHNTSPSNPDNSHGTAVAGLIAAKALNGIGGRGVAPNANIVSYNMLESQGITPYYLALEALVRNLENPDNDPNKIIDIYNNSWGFPNHKTRTLMSKDLYTSFKNQLEYGVLHGRKDNGTKKGAIYVKSAGNSKQDYWDTNYSPLEIERYMIVTGASGADGEPTSYSTPGESVWISAPGGGIQAGYLEVDRQMIVTSDLSTYYQGYDYKANNGIEYHFDVNGNEEYDYTNRMNGTSAAGPLVSGVIALMLEVNPALTWRDIRYILAVTAQQRGEARTYDIANLPPLSFNRELGFGRVNAKLAVELAKNWKNKNYHLPEEINYSIIGNNTNATIGNTATANVDFDFSASTISKVDFVNIEFSIAAINTKKYTFTPSKPSQTIEAGRYKVKLGLISNAKNRWGDLISDENAKFRIGNIEIPISITAGASATEKEIIADFDAGAIQAILDTNPPAQSANWTLSLEKGAPKPSSEKFTVSLVSPDGTKAEFIKQYPPYGNDTPKGNGLSPNQEFYKTRMGSSRFLDKDPRGTWTLEVLANDDKEITYMVKNAKVEIYGR